MESFSDDKLNAVCVSLLWHAGCGYAIDRTSMKRAKEFVRLSISRNHSMKKAAQLALGIVFTLFNLGLPITSGTCPFCRFHVSSCCMPEQSDNENNPAPNVRQPDCCANTTSTDGDSIVFVAEQKVLPNLYGSLVGVSHAPIRALVLQIQKSEPVGCTRLLTSTTDLKPTRSIFLRI